MNNWIIKFRVFLWLTLAVVVGWLLYMGVVPSGKISYIYDFTKPSYFIGKLTPNDRIEAQNFTSIQNGHARKIIGDPVYFALRTPRRFDKAKLILKYNNNISIIEAGVLVDKTIWRYDLQPIENKIINDLAMVWDARRENEIILLQRNKRYNSIDEFLNNLPNKSEIALYNYDLKKEFLLPDYGQKKSSLEASGFSSFYALRGPYQFYTYIKDEDLDFVFSFKDLNKNKDSDPVDLHLYYDNQLIDSRHLDDDGIAVDNGEESEQRELKLKLANLPEGVYKIELRVNNDIVTEKIITKQWRLAFINKIWLADNGNENISLFTDSREVMAQTINPANLQTIKVGSSELSVNQTYKQFNIEAKKDEISEIVLEKDDIILAGGGVFSFNKDCLINPKFKKVDSKLNLDSINYILAKYELPKKEDKWKIAEAEFDLTKAYREDGKYSFLISIPGLRADDEIDDVVEIGEIRMELKGKSLRNKIKDLFKK